MPTLTKENAKHHCRTCLKRLGHGTDYEFNGVETPEYKELCINIASNNELQQLITKYVDNYWLSESRTQLLPMHVCLCCYNKLNCFERFRREAQQNAEKLLALLNGMDGVTKVEIEYVDEVGQQQQEQKQQTTMSTMSAVSNNPDDIYKLLLKDALMETESVVLHTPSAAALTSVNELHDPDPFDTETTLVKRMNDSSVAEDNSDVEPAWLEADKAATESATNSSDCSEMQLSSLATRSSKVKQKIRAGKVATPKQHAKNHETLSHNKEAKVVQAPEYTSRAITRSRSKRNTAIEAKKPEKRKRRTKQELVDCHQTLMQPDAAVAVDKAAVPRADLFDSKRKHHHRGTKNSFKCIQCNHCFAHKITLDAHVRKVHEGSKRPFQCDRCDKSYTFIGGLYTHIKEIHDAGVRSYSCDFPDCDRIYTSFIAMQKHKRMKHTETPSLKKYVCEKCGTTFNQSGNLKYHRRTKHPTDAEQAEKAKSQERFQCDICQKHFHSRYTLKYHTLQLHTNETKYECTVCGRRMAKKFMLVQHMLIHSKDRMPCEHCGRQFIRKFELEAHIRAVHMKLKPFECQYCSECFASRKTLRHHEYIHTGEKPYVCNICGQAYRQQTCLKNHRRTHEKASANTEQLLAANNNRTLMMNTLLTSAPVEAEAAGKMVADEAAVAMGESAIVISASDAMKANSAANAASTNHT